MYLKEVNDASPMRVFEKSIHGGLGSGNVGVVAARAGVGKSPLLVQIALDDLLRHKKVLHLSHEHPVEHVRAYYDELFHDLVQRTNLDNPEQVHLDIERNRLIFSHLGQGPAPMSVRGGESSISKIRESLTFARDVAHFEPDVIIVDHFDFEHCSEQGIRVLREIAQERSVEVWTSATTNVPAKQIHELPEPIRAFEKLLSVVVLLEPEGEMVRLRLLKDHDSKELADLSLRLDAHSMRIVDEDVPPMSERPLNPRGFKLHSGGARGTEAAFGALAERYGVAEINYSFEGHRLIERRRGVRVLTKEQLERGDFSLKFASKRLDRVLSDIPLVRSVLQSIWYQVNSSSQVFVVGMIQEDGTVRGGTGWGAELARLWKKPLFVFDQEKKSWFLWSGKGWEAVEAPRITRQSFCGTGTQELSDAGREAIEQLYERSFGPAK